MASNDRWQVDSQGNIVNNSQSVPLDWNYVLGAGGKEKVQRFKEGPLGTSGGAYREGTSYGYGVHPNSPTATPTTTPALPSVGGYMGNRGAINPDFSTMTAFEAQANRALASSGDYSATPTTDAFKQFNMPAIYSGIPQTGTVSPQQPTPKPTNEVPTLKLAGVPQIQAPVYGGARPMSYGDALREAGGASRGGFGDTLAAEAMAGKVMSATNKQAEFDKSLHEAQTTALPRIAETNIKLQEAPYDIAYKSALTNYQKALEQGAISKREFDQLAAKAEMNKSLARMAQANKGLPEKYIEDQAKRMKEELELARKEATTPEKKKALEERERRYQSYVYDPRVTGLPSANTKDEE